MDPAADQVLSPWASPLASAGMGGPNARVLSHESVRSAMIPLTPDQRDLLDLCRDFGEREIRPNARRGGRGRRRNAVGPVGQGRCGGHYRPVSYTHLTLPTIYSV